MHHNWNICQKEKLHSWRRLSAIRKAWDDRVRWGGEQVRGQTPRQEEEKIIQPFQHLPTADNSPVVILSRLGTSGGRAAGESNPHRPPVIGKDNRTDYTNGSSKLWSGESRATSTGKWTVRLSHQLLWLVWLRPGVHTPGVQLCCSAKHSGSLTPGTPKIVFHGLLHVFAFLNPAVTVLPRSGRLAPDSRVLKRKRK